MNEILKQLKLGKLDEDSINSQRKLTQIEWHWVFNELKKFLKPNIDIDSNLFLYFSDMHEVLIFRILFLVEFYHNGSSLSESIKGFDELTKIFKNINKFLKFFESDGSSMEFNIFKQIQIHNSKIINCEYSLTPNNQDEIKKLEKKYENRLLKNELKIKDLELEKLKNEIKDRVREKDLDDLNLTETNEMVSIWDNFIKSETYPLLADDFPKTKIDQQLHSIVAVCVEQ
ncbi:hypothetical protein Glove_21g136 [Diversispora epigaea]|uniref:Uncharacterized protein n=1 Tax=Diversispora epigaea TaxID=1348612 RepID=A0A397JRW3_9GLOM|nr:hypothetical protein Glove_21g136 [Diversispora epigaea]